ncbi:MAG: TraI domain-containing protein [Betaproteobacteria bacterium]|nr:TraI domain-containing protein [Betaproteobacteria bacterium]
MTAAGWLRQIGLALGRRDAAGDRRVHVAAAGSARAIAGGSIASVQGDTLPVLRAPTLITRLDAGGLIARIGDHAHASADNFQRHYAPVIDRFLEFAQLLPASESHHHAQPGGMALHTLETVQHALQRRQGLMLPPGAPTEAQQRQQHRWTYAVFVAALLHDTGKAAHDLRITYDSPAHANAVWNPLAGSLPALAAERYRVDFAHGAARDYAAHRRFPLVLLPQFVPTPVLGWLAEESALLQELAEYLCGERRDGALAELVAVGDRESVRRNLLTGPRQRFASARNVPLIERLMDALRKMLADGAWLPLNRDGAAGWVADDAVWLVSKRLADEVRRFLHAQGDTAVPGEDKNDRLFDVWQEYGAVVPNPATGGAVWRARVEGADYAHELTLLRFPLARLWPEATGFPSPMQGRIVVLPAAEPTPAAASQGARAAAPGGPLRHHIGPIIVRLHTGPRCSIRPTMRRAWSRPRPVRPRGGHRCRRRSVHCRPCTKIQTNSHPRWRWRSWRGCSRGGGRSLRYNESGALVHFVTEGLFLVSPGVFRAYAEAHPTASSAEPGGARDWPGKAVQRAVCGAGWNRKGPRNKSVLTYRVAGREGKPGKALNGVVVLHPERFFAPVPPANPHLQRAPDAGGQPTA